MNMHEYATKKIAELQTQIGTGKALCALSGGVDSSVAAVLAQKAVGTNLICIFVDTGLMRQNEGDEVEAMFGGEYNFVRVNAAERFLAKLKGITDPEQKRKIVGEEFIRVFEEEAKKIGQVDFFLQGTIYPDIVESKGATHIKSHHNVGGLPDVIDFKEIIEPLRELYKPQVRELGLALGMPHKMVYRQPFPGPGLAVRCLGEITEDKLKVLRQADYIFREEVEAAGLDIWQYFAVLAAGSTVGVKDGKRAYGHTIALRAVNSEDAMTATWSKIPFEVLGKVSSRIAAEVVEVNRVVYDVTDKPPGTIEWE